MLNTLQKRVGHLGFFWPHARKRRSLFSELAELKRANLSLACQLEIVKRQRDQILQKSLQDPLTGLWNRSGGEEHCVRLFSSLQRGETAWINLLFLDLDNFKSVNDTLGHAQGDRLLQNVAATIKQHCRSHDILCRWGGDEFVVILNNIDASNACCVAEKLRGEIKRCCCPYGPTIGVSIGMMSISAEIMRCLSIRSTDFMDYFINQADRALYRSKEGGKNRVTISNADMVVSMAQMLHYAAL
jgi:diguanylate cyclase (GGDEF)-like protein